MKNLLNVSGAQLLSKDEQQSINGGKTPNWCQTQPNGVQCGGTPDYRCSNGLCRYCPAYPLCN